MSSWAVPGAVCECVDATDHPELVVGEHYTVLRALPFKASIFTTGKFISTTTIVDVLEAKNRTATNGFAIERFRPLTKSTKTQEEDIAMFWDILAEEGEKV